MLQKSSPGVEDSKLGEQISQEASDDEETTDNKDISDKAYPKSIKSNSSRRKH